MLYDMYIRFRLKIESHVPLPWCPQVPTDWQSASVSRILRLTLLLPMWISIRPALYAPHADGSERQQHGAPLQQPAGPQGGAGGGAKSLTADCTQEWVSMDICA